MLVSRSIHWWFCSFRGIYWRWEKYRISTDYLNISVCISRPSDNLLVLAFTYRHTDIDISLQSAAFTQWSQTKAYLCKGLGNLPSSFQHIGSCLTFTWAPLPSQLPSPTPVASQQSVCVTLHPPAPARRGLPTHSNTCSPARWFWRERALSEKMPLACHTVVTLAFLWRAWKADSAYWVTFEADLPDAVIQNIFQLPALHALTRYNSNAIKEIMKVRQEFYKHFTFSVYVRAFRKPLEEESFGEIQDGEFDATARGIRCNLTKKLVSLKWVLVT